MGKKKQSSGQALLEVGDYVRAREALKGKAANADLSEAERSQARRLESATRLDPPTVYVGLACAALLVLTVILVALRQP